MGFSIDIDVSSPINAIGGAVGGAAKDIVHAIESVPGVDWITSDLENFAKSDFGTTVLRALSSTAYIGLAPVLGPQFASIAFAIPGMAKGDSIADSYVNELAYRVKTTADILTAGQGGAALSAQAKTLMSQVDIAGQEVMNQAKALGANLGVPTSIDDVLSKAGVNAQSIAAKLGIREDMAQSAIDAATRKLSFAMPGINVPGLFSIPARGGATFDPKTGKQTTTPAVLKQWQALSQVLEGLKASLPAMRGVQYTQTQAQIGAITAQRALMAQQSGGTLPPYPVDVSAGMLNAFMAGGAQRGDARMLALLTSMAKGRVLQSMSAHFVDMNKQVGGSGALG